MDGRSRVLIVEDDAALRSSLLAVLAQQDFEVRAVADGSTFGETVGEFCPDLALIDVGLPGDLTVSILPLRWPRRRRCRSCQSRVATSS